MRANDSLAKSEAYELAKVLFGNCGLPKKSLEKLLFQKGRDRPHHEDRERRIRRLRP